MKEIATLLLANYNNGRYLPECIASVLGQTSDRWELIIVDDKSTDNSCDVYRQFQSHPAITTVYNDINLGYTRSLRKLIDSARSDIVAIVDPDDKLVPTCIEEVMGRYDSEPEIGFLYTNFWVCDEEMNVLGEGYCREIPEGTTNLEVDCVSHLKTFRRSVYYRTDGYDEAILYAEDKDLTYKMEEVTPLVFLDQPLYYYRTLADSQSHGRRWRTAAKSFARAKRRARRRRGQATVTDRLLDGWDAMVGLLTRRQ